MKKLEGYLWNDRKRPFFGLPLSFTTYKINNEKLIVHSGIINLVEEEIRTYRIMDITLKRDLYERLFGLGTIVCNTADQTMPIVEIRNVKNCQEVKDMMSNVIEAARDSKNIKGQEFLVH